MTTLANCKHCGGSGWVARDPDWKCPHCKGEGLCACGHCAPASS